MSTPTVFPARHAYLIGVQAYTDPGIRPLKTPVQDVQLMASALAAYGYQTQLCLNPDLAAFMRFLQDSFANKSDLPEQLIIYFAGHGVALSQQPAEGPPTYGGYLLPTDANRARLPETTVSMQWLADEIHKLSSKQVLLILDCCYAGVMRQAATGFRGGIETDVDAIFQEDFGHYTRYRANQILTSSAHNQQALDQYLSVDSTDTATPILTSSPFATLLAQALANQEADSNRDGVVTVYELQLYIQQRLEAAASQQEHEQTSCLFAFASHEGGEFVFLTPDFDPTSLRNREHTNPYKGLDAYQPEDKAFFFGRDAAIRDLNKLLDSTNFLIVVGASGTGKSSLVRGGILGQYEQDNIPYAIVRPGTKPFAELDNIRQKPPRLLLIDQLEELVTQAGPLLTAEQLDEQLVRFFGELSAFQQSENGQQTKIIATMRIEFVPQFNRQGRFWNSDTQQFAIPVLDVEGLQEIIIRPALKTGMFYYPEKETVARIIEDFRHYPNALPLLSLALNELYESAKGRPERTIYERDYPGIGQILEQKEESILQPFQNDIPFFRDLLLRFVALQGGEYVRRRVDLDELAFEPSRQPLCNQMLTIMTENRLLAGRDVSTGDGYYELTHEALIRAWSTYRQWIQQVGPAQLTQREELAEAAKRYIRLPADRRAYAWGSVALLNLLRTGNPNGLTTGWLWHPFGSQLGKLSWLSVPERAFLSNSVWLQRQTKIALLGLGLVLLATIGIALFFQNQETYTRLISNAQSAESQNAYKTAQQDYRTADTLARQDLVLRAGRGFLRFHPDTLPIMAHRAGQRDTLYSTLSKQLERADQLTNKTVLLLAGRNDPGKAGAGVAQVCRAFGQFIETDSLYRALESRLEGPRARALLSRATLDRLQSQARTGYQLTGVLRENLLATCREVQESYLLNSEPTLSAQYGQYGNALEQYRQRLTQHYTVVTSPASK